MLSVATVAAGGIGYYVDTVASGIDDYYLRTDPGWWAGAGADRLGLAGRVPPGAIEVLAAAAHPVTGTALGAPGGKVAAYDLTFSAPKSVSLLAEVADDPALRAAVIDAHRVAITEAVALIEAEAVRGRRGHAGAVSVGTTGMVAAGFDHHTSRAGDPQLHTHLLVANRALGTDGRWGALDGRRLYAWAKTAGYVYEASLRHHLTERLGVAWTPVTNGIADVAGIPAPALAAFATRRAQIVAALDRAGATTSRAAQVATLATRPAKPEPLDAEVQRRVWQARAWDVGLDAGRLGRDPHAPQLVARRGLNPGHLAATLAAPSGLTLHRSGFDRRHLLQAVAAAAPDGARVDEVVSAARTVLADERFVATGTVGPFAGPVWTTAELAAVETGLLAGMDRRRDQHLGLAESAAVDAALASRHLSGEQAAMVRAVTRSGHGVEVVVGPAGTGKTTAIDAAAAAWAASGVEVIGTALAARTARALEAGTGIPSTTVDQLLADAARPGLAGSGVLPAGGVVVVDEAGMVGTRKLARLLTLAERSRAKVLLVGDPRQLPEIEAGGAFAALAARHPAVTLSTNRRQEQAWERDALAELRAGAPAAAIFAYRDHGRITLTATAADARAQLVEDWAAGAHPAGTVMVALTRADVDDLNARALDRLEATGRLDPGRDRLGVGARTFGIGERVMALRNDRRAGVVNGTTGEVTAVDPTAGTLTVAGADGRPVTVGTDYLADGHLVHGWAITAHKAQGITTGRAYVLGTDRLYREAGYVALSRATERTDWYQAVPLTPPGAPLRDPHDDLARQLSRSGAQQLATAAGPVSGHDVDGARRAALLADPPAELTAALGPPPLSGASRARWVTAALTVDSYRLHHRITGPDLIGAQPSADADDRRYREWVLARLAITETRRHLGLDVGLDQGLSR